MSEISKQALQVENSTSFPNNNTGYISPAILRAFNSDLIDSTVNQTVYTADSGSWNSKITSLQAFTSSQQPSFNSLNAFTASQAIVNTNLNAFTQSAGASITGLNLFSSSFNTYTASINQIRSNNVTLGNSTIFNFVGPGTFFSASLVQNVQGNIATLTFTSDNGKVNTSSFNEYTASTAASQSLFSASVASSITSSNALFNQYTASTNVWTSSAKISINALNQFTASDNTSQAALNQFTASQQLLNGTFATTGSNTFYGQQIIQDNPLYVFNSSIQLAKNIEGSGSQYIGVYSAVDATTDPNNVFSGYLISSDTGNTMGYAISSYNDPNGNTTYCWYGPGTGNNNVYGTPDNVMFQMYGGDSNLFIKRNTILSGSLIVTGSTVLRGPLSISSSATYDIDITGGFQATAASRISGSAATLALAPTFTQVSGSLGSSLMGRGYINAVINENYISLYASGSSNLGPQTNAPKGVAGIAVGSGSQASPAFYYPIYFQSGLGYTDGRVTITKPLEITGSVYQNVSASSITAQTASIDLSVANYFTLTLSGSTNINVLNPKPGVTATLLINTSISGSATFSSNVKQPSGSAYVASPSGNIDIISLTSLNSTTVYAVPAYTFV